MISIPTIRPSWEVPHSLGSILWREARSSYEVRLRPRPREPQRSTYVKGPRSAATYARAERNLADRISAAGRGERAVSRTLTVGRWLDEWLELQVGLRPGSRTAYETRIRLYLKPVLGRARLAELEAPDVTRAMSKLRTMRGARGELLSAGTVDAAFRTLNAALGDAWDLGKAPRNACRGSSRQRPSTHIEPPTQPELDRLFEELEADPWRPVFSVLRWTGMRLGEALGLEWRFVDLEAGILTIRRQASGDLKAGRPRTVVLPVAVVDELRGIPRRLGSPYVFTTSSGKPLAIRNVRRHFDAALERAGIAPDAAADLDKYRPHDLRHAFATMLLEAGVAPSIVIAWLGWSSLAMLDRYGHVRAQPGGDAYRRLVEAYGHDLEGILGLRATNPLTAIG